MLLYAMQQLARDPYTLATVVQPTLSSGWRSAAGSLCTTAPLTAC